MTRSTTEDYRRLDVRELDKAGLLAAGRGGMWSWYSRGTLRASIQVQAGDGHVRLIYAATENGERKEYSYLVRLDWTPCQYGGARPWFLCPARGCGQRVAILYGGAIFACRHCYRLAYESQRERDYNRLAGRGQNPAAAGLACGHPKPETLDEAEGDALADLQAADRRA